MQVITPVQFVFDINPSQTTKQMLLIGGPVPSLCQSQIDVRQGTQLAVHISIIPSPEPLVIQPRQQRIQQLFAALLS